jgi:hypothetical protein
MRLVRLLAVLGLGVSAAGCFQMTTLLKVKDDGSGTIDHRMVYSTRALAQMRGLASLRGGGAAPIIVDPLSEQQARDLATSIGPGVAYVASTPIATPESKGREATYAFADVTQLRISTQPAAPGGVTIRAGGISTESESVTFSLEHAANGNAILHIHVPEPGFLDALGSPQASGQIGMVKTMLGGAHVLLQVEPSGTVVRSSSPFVEGSRVTLLEIDLDEVLKDETLVARLQATKSREEAMAILKSAPGLKINFDRDITVEFTPAK